METIEIQVNLFCRLLADMTEAVSWLPVENGTIKDSDSFGQCTIAILGHVVTATFELVSNIIESRHSCTEGRTRLHFMKVITFFEVIPHNRIPQRQNVLL